MPAAKNLFAPELRGTASNGVDYSTLSGFVTFAADVETTNITVQALTDFQIEGDETVTLTLGYVNDGYLIDTNAAAATMVIHDTIKFEPVAIVTLPIGIDYSEPLQSLIVSYNYSPINSGYPYNFARIYTNSVVTIVTNWSGIQGVSDEVKLATVKTNLSGFTNGDMYFGSGAAIGWLSSNGVNSNLTWCVLTNGVATNALPLRGSLYVDQTGAFSNNIIAVTSEGTGTGSPKGVWRVDSQAHPTLLATINTPHLEGVVTLPNDVQRWGPWAGKIITGDEDQSTNNLPRPLIYTISTNGVVATNDTTTLFPEGIFPEDFDIIPPNQNLYICDYGADKIVKLSANYFTNYVGDLLITQAGEPDSSGPKLFILHWDTASTNFVVRSIPHLGSQFEHVTFAPINLPPLP